jgi:hypothetical protein
MRTMPGRACAGWRLDPKRKVGSARVVGHAVRIVAGDVEVQFATDLLPLGYSGGVDALSRGDLK